MRYSLDDKEISFFFSPNTHFILCFHSYTDCFLTPNPSSPKLTQLLPGTAIDHVGRVTGVCVVGFPEVEHESVLAEYLDGDALGTLPVCVAEGGIFVNPIDLGTNRVVLVVELDLGSRGSLGGSPAVGVENGLPCKT